MAALAWCRRRSRRMALPSDPARMPSSARSVSVKSVRARLKAMAGSRPSSTDGRLNTI